MKGEDRAEDGCECAGEGGRRGGREGIGSSSSPDPAPNTAAPCQLSDLVCVKFPLRSPHYRLSNYKMVVMPQAAQSRGGGEKEDNEMCGGGVRDAGMVARRTPEQMRRKVEALGGWV
ncbi:unnamed protein product [Pleuronectes platessa]|uniref:Uncharacterized protein n=1 Tax=Pleuronectes platessa TaxID=8262 RepID=A0A9N7YVK4_PLEPL|nr:unnamed protein product [Pleuronectes platessa]